MSPVNDIYEEKFFNGLHTFPVIGKEWTIFFKGVSICIAKAGVDDTVHDPKTTHECGVEPERSFQVSPGYECVVLMGSVRLKRDLTMLALLGVLTEHYFEGWHVFPVTQKSWTIFFKGALIRIMKDDLPDPASDASSSYEVNIREERSFKVPVGYKCTVQKGKVRMTQDYNPFWGISS